MFIGRKIIFTLLLCLSGVFLFMVIIRQCKNRNVYSDYKPVCFQKDVLPVMLGNCAFYGCHDQDSKEGGYDLSSYRTIMKGITPFKPEKSKIYQSIMGTNSVTLMPPGDSLTRMEKILINIWIGQGAQEIICDSVQRYVLTQSK